MTSNGASLKYLDSCPTTVALNQALPPTHKGRAWFKLLLTHLFLAIVGYAPIYRQK